MPELADFVAAIGIISVCLMVLIVGVTIVLDWD